MNENVVLFLCTGNYYRSRFAELLFNALAEARGLEWRAESRGLAANRGTNPGAISQLTLTGLRERGIAPPETLRFPLQVTVEDFYQARRIIALDAVEHRPMMWREFPLWAASTEYWEVHDIDATPAAQAFAQIETHVQALLEQLNQ